MSSEWAVVPLGSLMSEPTRNGVHKGPDYQGSGTALIKMGEVYSADFVDPADRDRLELTEREVAALEVRPGDLLFCRTSLVAEGVGHCALVRSLSEPTVFASNLIRVRLRPDVADSRYWFHYFRSPEGQRQRLSLARGTSVTTITGPDISSMQVALPSLDEQRRIAGVLGALDDKIEHDLRCADDLERLASTHFRRLFPWIEGGEILGDHVEVAKGKSYKSKELATSTTALVTLKSIKRGGGYSPGGLKPYVGEYKPEQVVKPGEIVVAQTDLTQAAEVIGKPAIVPGRNPYETIVASLDIAVVRRRSDRVSRLFVYHLLMSEPFQQHAYAHSNGSTVLHLAKEAIPSFAFELPDPERLAKFDRLAEPLLSQAEALDGGAETLRAVQTALLPKLVSGQIRVPESYDPYDALGTIVEQGCSELGAPCD